MVRLKYRLRRANPKPLITVRKRKVYLNLRASLLFGSSRWFISTNETNCVYFNQTNEEKNSVVHRFSNGKHTLSGTHNLTDGKYAVKKVSDNTIVAYPLF